MLYNSYNNDPDWIPADEKLFNCWCFGYLFRIKPPYTPGQYKCPACGADYSFDGAEMHAVLSEKAKSFAKAWDECDAEEVFGEVVDFDGEFGIVKPY